MAGLRPWVGRPAKRISPWLGGMRPTMMLSSVGFPQPLGPTTPTNCPGSTSRSMPCSACTSRPRDTKRLLTPRSERMGGATLPLRLLQLLQEAVGEDVLHGEARHLLARL